MASPKSTFEAQFVGSSVLRRLHQGIMRSFEVNEVEFRRTVRILILFLRRQG